MPISTLALIVFFSVYGISYFTTIPYSALILAVAAIVAAIALALRK